MKLLSVELFGNPDIDVREVLPNTPLEDKNKKPFKARYAACIKVKAKDKTGNRTS